MSTNSVHSGTGLLCLTPTHNSQGDTHQAFREHILNQYTNSFPWTANKGFVLLGHRGSFYKALEDQSRAWGSDTLTATLPQAQPREVQEASGICPKKTMEKELVATQTTFLVRNDTLIEHCIDDIYHSIINL